MIPFVMFASWEAAILGSLPGMTTAAAFQQLPPPAPALAASSSGQGMQQQQAPAVSVAGAGGGQQEAWDGGASPSGRVEDPLALLAQASGNVGPLIQGFSFLAIATSYIGFVLGLTDFFAGEGVAAGHAGGLCPVLSSAGR